MRKGGRIDEEKDREMDGEKGDGGRGLDEEKEEE